MINFKIPHNSSVPARQNLSIFDITYDT